jgi:hypothetical protein
MKRENVKREDERGAWVGRSHWRAIALVILTFHVFTFSPLATPALADPSQEDVLRSIGQNVGETADLGRLTAVLALIAGVIALLVVVGQWRGRSPRPSGLHHHGKLMKEVLRTVPLKPAELKQLKLLMQESAVRGGEGGSIESPLTLVLCPSVLLKAAQARSGRINAKVVAGLAKKLGSR